MVGVPLTEAEIAENGAVLHVFNQIRMNAKLVIDGADALTPEEEADLRAHRGDEMYIRLFVKRKRRERSRRERAEREVAKAAEWERERADREAKVRADRERREREAREAAAKPKPKPKAAGVIVRVSTEDQSRSGYSKQDQLNWAQVEAKRLGLELNEYVEEGGAHSDMLDREALNAFEQDVVDGKVGTLFLRYADRLGRGAVFTKLIEWLKAWQVRIICGDMPDAGDATDMLMSFYGAQGGSFLKTLRSRTKDGVRNARAAGKHVGGQLLGFRWEDGKWLPEQWALDLANNGGRSDLPKWQRQRAVQAINAYTAGPDAFNELLEKRRSSSRDRHMAARRRQEERNNDREGWLLAHRPIVIDRVAL